VAAPLGIAEAHPGIAEGELVAAPIPPNGEKQPALQRLLSRRQTLGGRTAWACRGTQRDVAAPIPSQEGNPFFLAAARVRAPPTRRRRLCQPLRAP